MCLLGSCDPAGTAHGTATIGVVEVDAAIIPIEGEGAATIRGIV